MAELRKVEAGPDRIRYARTRAQRAVAAAIAVGAAVVGLPLLGQGRFVLFGFIALVGLLSLLSALSHDEIVLDRRERRLRQRQGLFFAPKTREEPFDAIERVVLKKELERRGTEEVVDEWEVELQIRGWPIPLEVFESKGQADARLEAESLAAFLGVELGERTGR